ncbi:hypothetical protein GW17_00002345 [Ensete ventricosum]|nr:hypothetical protein GW17_00002345 [Ensete ventricosum]
MDEEARGKDLEGEVDLGEEIGGVVGEEGEQGGQRRLALLGGDPAHQIHCCLHLQTITLSSFVSVCSRDLYLRRDSSHGGHVIVAMPDMLPTAYCQGACRLVGLSRLASHAVVRLLSRALQAGRPVALALSSHQPPVGKGATDWSTRCICSAMLSTPFRTIGRLLSGTLRTRSGLRLPQLETIRCDGGGDVMLCV